MTTKPKAKKFRIRPNSPLSSAGKSATSAAQKPPAENEPLQLGQAQQAAQPKPQQPPAAPPANSPQPKVTATSAQGMVASELADIKKEGLTGRQLRMARRVAQKNGLAPTSDYDAVRLLRAKGIDPFQRANALELVTPTGSAPDSAAETGGGGGNAATAGTAVARTPQSQVPARVKPNLPQTKPTGPQLPAHADNEDESPAARRNREVAALQRDIVRRRRRRLGLLLIRLIAFIGIPTAIAAYYFYNIATPMYSTKSAFVIQQADGGAASSSGGGLGGMLSGGMNSIQDSISVQAYLESRDAMMRLDNELGFKEHFQQDFIDPIQRLEPDATNEAAYKIYKRRVLIGYDPTEMVINMEVIAVDPETSKVFADRLIEYAEERVDELTARKREDQLELARESLEKARQDRRAAQEDLIRLQREADIIDPEALIGQLRASIGARQTELEDKQLELAALLDNRRPNRSKVEGVQADIRRLETLLERLGQQMTEATEGEESIGEISTRVQLAMSDLEMQNMMLQQALQGREAAQIEATRQTRFLSRSVDPVVPDEAAYPRAFENSILAFVCFAGIYLMISLTASVLREQISN